MNYSELFSALLITLFLVLRETHNPTHRTGVEDAPNRIVVANIPCWNLILRNMHFPSRHDYPQNVSIGEMARLRFIHWRFFVVQIAKGTHGAHDEHRTRGVRFPGRRKLV